MFNFVNIFVVGAIDLWVSGKARSCLVGNMNGWGVSELLLCFV